MAEVQVNPNKAAKSDEILIQTSKRNFTADELLNLKIKTFPWLIDNMLPQTGIVGLVGSSDTGKSTLARQLAISIARGDNSFLGFQLNSRRQRALYVSTEDDYIAMSYLLNRQNDDNIDIEGFKNLHFVFSSDPDQLGKILTDLLDKDPFDVIILDTFSDLYTSDMNSSNLVRKFINNVSETAMNYDCLVIFMHHTGKRTENFPPSKDNVLGSQGFESRMRVLIELRRDNHNAELRHLCVVKGNYIPAQFKQKSFVLRFNENNITFEDTGDRVDFHLIRRISRSEKDVSKELAKIKAVEYDKKGLSTREIEEELEKQGIFGFKKSAISRYLSEYKRNQKEETDNILKNKQGNT